MSAVTQALPFLPVEIGRKPVSPHWCETRDGDPQALELFRRHYSCDEHEQPVRSKVHGYYVLEVRP